MDVTYSRVIPLVLLGLLLVRSAAPAAETTPAVGVESYKSAGTFAVATIYFEWLDEQRHRRVPTKVYYPKTGDGPFPIIVFSHGLGGSRETYAYLGQHWAGHGYVAVHLQHPGSDVDVWQKVPPQERREAMRAAMTDLSNILNRPRDIGYAIDQLEIVNRREGPLRGRLDLAHIGVAGHSFGAYTTLAVAGQTFVGPRGNELTLADNRVQAAIAMSSPAPLSRENLGRLYGSIKIPMLHLTGTNDTSMLNEVTKPGDRRIPFENSVGPDKYLAVFQGGDHMVFSGRSFAPGVDRARDDLLHDLIRISTTAFWDAYLKGDAKAKDYLTANGGFQATLGKDGSWEKK